LATRPVKLSFEGLYLVLTLIFLEIYLVLSVFKFNLEVLYVNLKREDLPLGYLLKLVRLVELLVHTLDF
jgi:hypothetical protein